MIYTAPGKCLIAWDMGQGPTFARDPLDQPIGRKQLGECEVWRAHDPENTGNAAVRLGVTPAEAFLDTTAQDGSVYCYWVMERMESGGLRQVGPTFDVEMPYSWEYPAATPPTPVDDFVAIGVIRGIKIGWKPAVDGDDENKPGRTGVLAYFVYDSDQDAPDSVVWVNEENLTIDEFTDELPVGTEKSYKIRALNKNLILSEAMGPITATAGGLQNLCPNPQFFFNIIDGWVDNGYLEVDADPPVALPTNCASSAHLIPTGAVTYVQGSEYFQLEPTNMPYWLSGYLYRPGGYRTKIEATFYGDDSGPMTISLYDDDVDDTEFVRHFWGIRPLADAYQVRFTITFYGCAAENEGEAWLTGFMIQPDPEDSDDPAAYADGDTEGWVWDGERHNSASRQSS